MADPITLAILAKIAGGVAGKLALKAFFLSKMVTIKAAIAQYAGASAANLSVGVLAAGMTALYWEKHIKKNSDYEAIDAAVAKGMTESAARGALNWLEKGIF